ncbi:MAG TPA: glutathione S-transferase family protein [Kofleriaceae bacterium]|nr:glutathione S-transferase family protein [Kofleriaceae bacterium]
MALTYYFHPLASYCHKALIALYENDTAFEPHFLDLQDPEVRAAYARISPSGKMPVLRDDARDRTVSEATIIIEYLDLHYPGRTRFVPDDRDGALEVRARDRSFDLYIHEPMQTIVGDRIRPEAKRDPHGVDLARAKLRTACDQLERELTDGTLPGRPWLLGNDFTLADCAAAPALFYADKVQPLTDHPQVAAYLARLRTRPSYARVLEEAQPYFHMFPG